MKYVRRPKARERTQDRESELVTETVYAPYLLESLLVAVARIIHDIVCETMQTTRNPVQEYRILLQREDIDIYAFITEYSVIMVHLGQCRALVAQFGVCKEMSSRQAPQ